MKLFISYKTNKRDGHTCNQKYKKHSLIATVTAHCPEPVGERAWFSTLFVKNKSRRFMTMAINHIALLSHTNFSLYRVKIAYQIKIRLNPGKFKGSGKSQDLRTFWELRIVFFKILNIAI